MSFHITTPAIEQTALMAENLTSDAPRIWCDQYLLRILTERGRNTISPLSRRKIILNLCLPCPDLATLSLGRTRRLCGGCSCFTPVHVSNILHKGWIALNMKTVIIAGGLWFWREPKGLYVRRITSYPIYIKDKVVAFNSCSFPTNATDKADLAQFPTSSAAVGSEDPREGTPQILEHQRTPREWIKECLLNLARLTCKWKNTNISRSTEFEWVMMWAQHHQNPPPQLKNWAAGFWGAIVGLEIWGPSPLCAKGPKPRLRSPTAEDARWKLLEGPRMWSRTISRSTPHKTPEWKDKLSTRAVQERKLPTP